MIHNEILIKSIILYYRSIQIEYYYKLSIKKKKTRPQQQDSWRRIPDTFAYLHTGKRSKWSLETIPRKDNSNRRRSGLMKEAEELVKSGKHDRALCGPR